MTADMLSHLSEELDNIEPEDISKYGLTLTVGGSWFVRLWWTDRNALPEIHHIRMLIDSRPDLLLGFSKAKNTKDMVRTARTLHEWTMPRGYSVGVSGANWRTRISLMLFAWMGGFRR